MSEKIIAFFIGLMTAIVMSPISIGVAVGVTATTYLVGGLVLVAPVHLILGDEAWKALLGFADANFRSLVSLIFFVNSISFIVGSIADASE